MSHMLLRLVSICIIVLLMPGTSFPMDTSPLEPPDTSSPRGTLESFMEATSDLSAALQDDAMDREEIWQHWNRGIRCFNLSEVPPTIVEDVALESVLLLREILDRLELPAMETVPDKASVRENSLTKWRLPHTEIIIGKVATGAKAGSFLFTPDTVERLHEYYVAIRNQPYTHGETQGLYEDYIYASGWMIPDGLIGHLPDWMREDHLGQTVWQWFGFVLVTLFMTIFLWGTLKVSRAWRARKMEKGGQLCSLFFPLFGMGGCVISEYLFRAQVNITGKVLTITRFVLEAMFFLFAAWGIIVLGNIVIHRIITSRHIKEEALDADVIKLVGRLVSISLVFVLFFNAGKYFGLPITAVFASAGIVGMAIALAARETLSNFFGGVSIFLDRPFKAGDYIVLDTGERGEVKAVGMRSTRLQTRDDVLITVPNSIITNVKIVNQSAPYLHFRVRVPVGIAYEADFDRAERILMEIAGDQNSVKKNPAPKVRLRTLGDWSVNLELLVWAVRPHDRGRIVHDLSKEIHRRFKEEGIKIPYPQHEVYLQSNNDE
ncbi:mechanosensitive ion channel family protein [uncultured Pseudodesulfovibrio sp.]|uniref:mechanosensitive ion channel family protein n=1 Tax=uncultured Pseudodesulfovibrio sp. TaxID=2035858 RepID=UPI0029C7F4BB|nr:mechanosensitive ion channel family protein [uncultured Pseudodesulfovibrio sp.]